VFHPVILTLAAWCCERGGARRGLIFCYAHYSSSHCQGTLAVRVVFQKQMEVEMKDEIARLRAHHIEDLRPIVKTLDALAKDVDQA
jgi:hypothetical protein